MIVFRILIGPQSGLGHLTRCLVLAKKLQEIGFSVVFIGDIIPPNIATFFNGFSHYSLYESMPQEWNQLHDAQSCINHLERYLAIEWVILDHYYLDAVWEGFIQNRGFKILAIDDLVRNHLSYALVDFKWRGVDNQLAYHDKVHPATRLLLGPQYLLAEVDDVGVQESASASAPPRILISFGGGGSGDDLVCLLQALTSEFNLSNMSIHLQAVIGPFLINKDKLRNFPERQGCVTFEYIENKTNLIPFLQACDFYLGAAGGTLYHLRLLKKPALTFSLVANQLNNQSQLDDIGHYLHLNDFQFSQVNLISQLSVVLLKNLFRIKKLFNYSKVSFDCLGAERIANFLKTGQTSPRNFMQEVSEDWTIITGDYAVRAVQDSDINHYLACRNLQYNCKNMIASRPIPVMNHYLWWFGTQRRSYLMVKQQEPILYIWDEVKYVENEPYLIGGWFVCSEQTSFQDSMVALDWQLKQCAADYPGVPWIAVISRQNKYVKLMNDYFGFKEIETFSRYGSLVKHLFPQADEQEFYWVYKSSHSDKGDSK